MIDETNTPTVSNSPQHDQDALELLKQERERRLAEQQERDARDAKRQQKNQNQAAEQVKAAVNNGAFVDKVQ